MFNNKRNDTTAEERPIDSDPFDLLIIGAGFSGAFTAEETCKKLSTGSKVAIVDPHGLLSTGSSSMNECFKMHTGVHYIGDRQTAEKCLTSSVQMASRFYEYILDEKNSSAPTRRGRHYLMSGSHDVNYVKRECEHLRACYAKLLNEYPQARNVFGDPSNFIRYLEPEEYTHVAPEIPVLNEKNKVEMGRVVLGIETAESQIDISLFQDYFKHTFKFLEERLSQFYGYTVVRISYSEDLFHYVVEAEYFDPYENRKSSRQFLAKSIVNCAWQNIDVIDKHLNFDQVEKVPASIRTKILVNTSVPESLKDMNTCIFFSGPHVSCTQMINKNSEKSLLITYEPETNAGHFVSGTTLDKILDENLKLICSTHLEPSQKQKKEERLNNIGHKIITGASSYIPDISNAKINSIHMGYVKMFSSPEPGNAYLYDPSGDIHKRREDGIQKRALCYYAFSGMKMSYVYVMAKHLAETIDRELLLSRALESFITDFSKKLTKNIWKGSIAKTNTLPGLLYSLKHFFLALIEKEIAYNKIDLSRLEGQLTAFLLDSQAGLKSQYEATLSKHKNLLFSIRNYSPTHNIKQKTLPNDGGTTSESPSIEEEPLRSSLESEVNPHQFGCIFKG